MAHQFKPGDLALIVTGPNAGHCVELISYHASGDVRLHSGCWTQAYVPSWQITGSGLTAHFEGVPGTHLVTYGLIGERCLMPLRGDFAPEQQKDKEVAA
ncbi:hypothetical protein [Pseudomonas viridiflava]|uniref:hypothetical protein n=1 Tax=Pseudomonas viridiflava TaxID=33069 RepID=UPI000F011776|nr:hypothetical protein [Pseudomonas viridiflava]